MKRNKDPIGEIEQHNLASEFMYGRTHYSPEHGFSALNFSEYIELVRAFGRLAASYDHTSFEEEFDLTEGIAEPEFHLEL